MERNLILHEYLNLRKQLNQGNKLANELTQFKFEIEVTHKSEYRLMAVVFGHQDRNTIELARRDKSGTWERSGFTRFKNFENYCSNFLSELEKDKKRRVEFKKHLTLEEMIQFEKDIQDDLELKLIGYDF